MVQYTFSLPDGRNVGQVSRSNAVTTLLFTPIISIQIEGEPPVVEPGSIAEFNIYVSNSGNYPAEVSVIRIVPQGTVIDPDIVTISAITVPGTPYSGTVALGTLEAGQTVTLTYFYQNKYGLYGQGSSRLYGCPVSIYHRRTPVLR
ncbi:hypothetical protein ACFSQ7_37280 [Paenibacillus rhizoplanae]